MVSAATSIQQHTLDSNWTDYFDMRAAVYAVMDHCDTLPSARTKEQHTHRVYKSGLKYFLGWAGHRLPTEDLLSEFIAHLKRDRGLKSSTIGSKYLAPVRLYLKKLARQHIPVHGPERDFVQDCKERLRGAAEDVKAPKPEETTILSPLDQYGVRLTRTQLERLFRSIERCTKKGRRDLALLYVGFTTGLRLAELQRMTLAAIVPQDDHYLIRVRGKRNNTTPVPLDHDGYTLVQKYVAMYNDGLDDGDPRRITDQTALWQPLLHGDNYAIVGVNGYDPSSGITGQAIRMMLKRRAGHALGISISPHDMRRTIAALGRAEHMDMDAIQQLLRHKNIGTTAKYIGKPPTWDVSLISRKRRFTGIQDNQFEDNSPLHPDGEGAGEGSS